MNIFNASASKMAKHHGKTYSNMNDLKNNYEEWMRGERDKPGLWPIYCKAYAYDKAVEYFIGQQKK